MMRLTQKDEEILYLLGDEVECARKLKAMPAGERKAYFDDKDQGDSSAARMAHDCKRAEGKRSRPSGAR